MIRQLWQSWLTLAHQIGNFQSRILLTAFYFIIVLPFGLAVTLFSDPLRRKSRPANSSWLERQTHDANVAAAQKQS